MWTELGAYTWLFAGTLLLEALAIPLGGAAVHHGTLGAPGVLAVAFFASLVRALARATWYRRTGRKRPSLLQRALAPRSAGFFRSLFWVSVLLTFGYVVAHFVHGLPDWVRIFGGTLGVVFLALLVARTFDLLPEPFTWLIPLPPPAALMHSATVGCVASGLFLIPWWPPPQVVVEDSIVSAFERRKLTPDMASLRWIDRMQPGVKNAFVPTRALVLASEPEGLPDVFLIHVGLSHDGKPSRVANLYNLTDTAAVAERDLVVWRKWSAWSIRLGERTHSLELADFRGEPPGRGAGWTRRARVQAALTHVQETGQFRGISRTSVKLTKPAKEVSFELLDGKLKAQLGARSLELELGRDQPKGEQVQASDVPEGIEISHIPTPLPGDLVTWSVDRLRAMPWIGSERMQWLKAVAFRAAERMESLEHELVGIDADELIAEELGDVLEKLPMARTGDIPNWPPEPMQPLLSPAMASEGRWVDLAADVVSSTDEKTQGSPFVFSFIRPDPSRVYNQVSVTLWDPRQIELHVAGGTVEPRTMTGEIGSGLIPREPESMERLVGAFNGAFQAVHGEFGMVENQRVILPPKPYGATVATRDDGTALFGTWPGQGAIPSSVVSLRQNMTPLVVDDAINPYRRHWWGGVPEGWTEETRTVRSAMCMTVEGYLGYFYSPNIDPVRLAEAMRRARCSYGIHLDMNAGHTGFEFYRVAPKGKLPSLDRPLDHLWEARGSVTGMEGYDFLARLMVRKMPLMNFPRYIHQSSRDFFYLTRRVLLPGKDIAGPLDAPEQSVPWGIVGVPGNEWPYAMASADLEVPVENRPALSFRLTRFDPKQLRPGSREGAIVGFELEPMVSKQAAGIQPKDVPASLSQAVAGEGAVGLWWVPRGFVIQSTVPQGAQQPFVWGKPAPTEETQGALCVSEGRLLTAIETRSGKIPAELWRSLVKRAGCTDALYLTKSPHVLLPDTKSDKTTQQPQAALWFARKPFAGAERFFQDTPILPPSQWALEQARRVPYNPNGNGGE